MKLYSKEKDYELYEGNMLDMKQFIADGSIDSIVCDPPYELNFMNKGWDNSGIAFDKNAWKQCYDALKEGGYLLAFGGSRTFHRIACAIEDAGFEIRDTIMWLHGMGFPKSMNIGLAIDKRNGVESKIVGTQTKGSSPFAGNHDGTWADGQKDETYSIRKATNEWAGYGSSLKPAFEPIIVARKPFKGSLIDNVIKNGVGGLNIDECRVESDKEDIDRLNKEWDREWKTSYNNYAKNVGGNAGFDLSNSKVENKQLSGRFPANVILSYDENTYEEVCGGFPNIKSGNGKANYEKSSQDNPSHLYTNIKSGNHFDDSGSACRYFYNAKASKKDRDEGLEMFEEKLGGTYDGRQSGTLSGKIPARRNTHPTVKNVELMQYLVRLVSPKGATIMDCFMGSGSTGKAVMFENRERNANYHFIGIELTEEYLPICKARIDYAINKYEYDKKLEDERTGQITLF